MTSTDLRLRDKSKIDWNKAPIEAIAYVATITMDGPLFFWQKESLKGRRRYYGGDISSDPAPDFGVEFGAYPRSGSTGESA